MIAAAMSKHELYEELGEVNRELDKYDLGMGTAYSKLSGRRRSITFRNGDFRFGSTGGKIDLGDVPTKVAKRVLEASQRKLERTNQEVEKIQCMYPTDVAEMAFKVLPTTGIEFLNRLALNKVVELRDMFPSRLAFDLVCNRISVKLGRRRFDVTLKLDRSGAFVVVGPLPGRRADYEEAVLVLENLDLIKDKLQEVKADFAQLGK